MNTNIGNLFITSSCKLKTQHNQLKKETCEIYASLEIECAANFSNFNKFGVWKGDVSVSRNGWKFDWKDKFSFQYYIDFTQKFNILLKSFYIGKLDLYKYAQETFISSDKLWIHILCVRHFFCVQKKKRWNENVSIKFMNF